jgi:hypothetical protein
MARRTVRTHTAGTANSLGRFHSPILNATNNITVLTVLTVRCYPRIETFSCSQPIPRLFGSVRGISTANPSAQKPGRDRPAKQNEHVAAMATQRKQVDCQRLPDARELVSESAPEARRVVA